MEEITSKLDNILTNSSKPSNSGKPPNIVVYSECQSSALCVKETLLSVLEKQRYTVYILNATQMLSAPWLNNVCLLVIAGEISSDITNRLKSYVVEGNGRLLCFGSNVLAEFVPEISKTLIKDEMGLFTYSKWKRIELFHRVLECHLPVEDSITNHLPNKISLHNSKNQPTFFDVSTFGVEETSQTPSFILLTSDTGAKTLFANVRLEIDFENVVQLLQKATPNNSDLCKTCNNNRSKTNNTPGVNNSENPSEPIVSRNDASAKYNKTRSDIFADLLQKHFCLICATERSIEPDYTVGRLFGDSACKRRFLQEIESRLSDNGVLKLKKISVTFCGGGMDVPQPSPTLLPVLVDDDVGTCDGISKKLSLEENVSTCDAISKKLSLEENVSTCDGISKKLSLEENVSTRDGILEKWLLEENASTCDGFSDKLFLEELHTRRLGRLGVYCGVMTSSMHVVDTRLVDGFIVVPRTLTRGVGRGENVWLSPEGCALFSLQIHVDSGSQFWGRLGFLQHCVTLAAVLCVRALPAIGQQLVVNLKWPNDIYADKRLKIGGAIASSIVGARDAICNLGVGVNLFNSLPTTCINDMIDALNARNGTKVQHLTLEKFVAILLNQFEQLIDMVEAGRIDDVIQLYYKHWLHSGSKVTVRTEDGCEQQVTIVGIDACGFLRVLDSSNRLFSVHPDGNSFDMLSGLIAPKVL